MSAQEDAAAEKRQAGIAYLLLVITFLIWSNSFVAARFLVGDDVPDGERLGPFHFVVVRFAPVALFCLLFFVLAGRAVRSEAWRLLKERPGLVCVLGLLNVWSYNLAFGEGQHRVAAGTGSLIIALSPIFIFLLAVAIGQERPTWERAAGLLLALGGIYVVVVFGAGKVVEGAYLEDAAILAIAPFSWAIYTVLAKPILGQYQALPTTFLILGVASLPALPFFFLDHGFRMEVALWGPERWSAALFLALACTVLGYWLWFEALRRLPASKTAVFIFLNPPLAIFFEWLWLGRRPQIGLVVGGFVVLGGVYLCLRPSRAATTP